MRIVALLLLVACSPDGLAVGVPWLDVPDAVSIVDARPGRANEIPVVLSNAGTADATVAADADPTPPFDVPGEDLRLAAGADGVLTLFFTPAGFEAVHGTLVVSTGLDRWRIPIDATVDRDIDDDGHDASEAGGDDCDDEDPTRFPGALEACDGVDQDCDGVVDDAEDAPRWWPDTDLDGHGDSSAAPYQGCDPPSGSVASSDDCDDARPDAFPGAVEVWYDGTDQDCDGNDDDQDLDGVPFPADCDDVDPDVHPGAVEVWYDGTDQDCDGNDDDQDLDGDPFPADCDDLDGSIGPSAPELDDGLDQDCDGLVDEGLFVRGTLVVTELMRDPAAVADNAGRWLELDNPSDGDVDLGAVVVTLATQATPLSPAWLAPGGVAVLCVNPIPAQNGGLSCDDVVQWPGGAHSVTIDGGAVRLDEVDWNGWPTAPGSSIELGSGSIDPDANDVPLAWCQATAPYGAGDLGTPGVVSPPCL